MVASEELTYSQRDKIINDSLIQILVRVQMQMAAMKTENLSPEMFDSAFHRYVKLRQEQDRIFDIVSGSQYAEAIAEFKETIQGITGDLEATVTRKTEGKWKITSLVFIIDHDENGDFYPTINYTVVAQ